jgi:hypothetical protein
MTDEWLTHASELKTIAVVGRLGIGKTCLSYLILEEIKKTKPCYIFKHPKPALIATRGYQNIYEFGQIEHLENCALYLDEPQLVIRRYEHWANDGLERLMSVCRQRNITLLLSTADTRFITRGIEYFCDLFVVMDIDANLCKQGSGISKIIKKNALITAREWRLPIGKYLLESREHFEWNGLYSFNKLDWFNDDWSKPFKIPNETAKQTPKETPKQTPNEIIPNETSKILPITKGDDV